MADRPIPPEDLGHAMAAYLEEVGKFLGLGAIVAVAYDGRGTPLTVAYAGEPELEATWQAASNTVADAVAPPGGWPSGPRQRPSSRARGTRMGEARRRRAEAAVAERRGEGAAFLEAERAARVSAFAAEVARLVRRHRIGCVTTLILDGPHIEVGWAVDRPADAQKGQKLAYWLQEATQALLDGIGPRGAGSFAPPRPDPAREAEVAAAAELLGLPPGTRVDAPRERYGDE